MIQKNELKVEEWLKRAQDDELSLQAVLGKGAPSTACFLAQQMVEKYLKAFLVATKGEFPKIHQLDLLLALCGEIDPVFTDLKSDIVLLSDYYVETRYPGEYPEFTKDEAEKAYQAARRVKEFALKKIKKISESN